MALTLLESAKYSTDVLQKGVIEIFARTSPILELLPFMDIAGNSYKYNIEGILPSVAFRGVGEPYVEGGGTLTQASEGLVIVGGDVDVDRYIVQTRGNINDIRANQTSMKSKALSRTFTNKFFHGNSSTDPLEFDGINIRLAGSAQEMEMAPDGAVIGVNELNELLDKVEGGADVLIMSKSMKREVQKILVSSTHYLQNGTDEFGRIVEYFGDVAIRTVEDSILPMTEDQGTTIGSTGSIYAIKFGAEEFVSGLKNGEVSVRDLGELDSLPVFRTRIEFYCGLAIFNPKAAARLKGIIKA